MKREQKNTGEILREAAAVIRLGWAQWRREQSGRHCALGAIGRASKSKDTMFAFGAGIPSYADADEAVCVAQRLLNLPRTSSGDCPLVVWNNADDQTGENVAAGLELAALLWDEERASSERPRVSTGDVLQPLGHGKGGVR